VAEAATVVALEPDVLLEEHEAATMAPITIAAATTEDRRTGRESR
jgi:hypothetical protein